MAKKKSEKKNNDNKDDGGKKDIGETVVVLKVDLHCEGCAGKVIKVIRCFDGVESVKIGDVDLNKLTVVGKVDPMKLREKVEQKMKKKVEVISPLPKKEKNDDKEKEKEKNKESGGEQKQQQKQNEKSAAKKDEKKSKEPPVTTAVLKVQLHCQGCIRKIQRVVRKSKGFITMSIDKQKDLVTVKGAMDMKALAEALKEKLKRPVEIVPPKKADGGENGKGGGGNEKDKSGGGNEKGKGGGGEAKAGFDVGGGNGGLEVDGQKMEYGGNGGYPHRHPHPQYGSYGYGSGYMVNHVHAPQLFSDENPNACAVM